MPVTEDLINFDIIETQKENIQSLPGGRSAKALASTFSPNPLLSPTPADTKNLNDAIRHEYELELQSIADSDDPLDVYDRYVKWTLSAYPSAQATPESQLRPLLERATKAFQSASHYKSDPRYLKLWLNYIRFFSDSARETFAYLSRHNIGEGLALFYEEFAAWLEGAGRWKQADEVYRMGIEREARPAERLIRKFAEFQHRFESRPQNDNEPSSPALPSVRPALVAKLDPFASAVPPASRNNDPQAPRPQAGIGGFNGASRTGRQKLAIFSDADAPASVAKGPGEVSSKGWDNIGTISERKKENIVEARPWTGETLKAGKKVGGPKMAVFRDESKAHVSSDDNNENECAIQQQTINPRTGKTERVFVDLKAVYPDGGNDEMSFEELRAAARGWSSHNWSVQRPRTTIGNAGSPTDQSKLVGRSYGKAATVVSHLVDSQESVGSSPNVQLENTIALDLGHTTAFTMGKDSKSSRPKKMRMKEVKGETQTIKLNLSSPNKPKMRRKMSAEPTMTLHTKAATEDILEIFNQPLRDVDPLAERPESEVDTDYDDDDYTSAGESTGTGGISGTSEFGDTQPDIKTDPLNSDSGIESVSPWSDFTASKHVPKAQNSEYESEDVTQDNTSVSSAIATQEQSRDDNQTTQHSESGLHVHENEPSTHESTEGEELTTPISPTDDQEDDMPRTRYVPIPPEDYEPPVRAPRDPAVLAQNRLPFMTPIVEKTESSFGALTIDKSDQDYFNSKTPSREAGVPFITPEIDENLLSSPFREIINDARPARLPKLDIYSSKPQSGLAKAASVPLIQDMRCNPVDESIRSTILEGISPPLATFTGYHDYRPSSFGKGPEIRKYIKALAKPKSDGKTTSSLCMPPKFHFDPCASISYTIRKELGKGAFAPVYLAEEEEQASAPEDDVNNAVNRLLAVKCEHPPTAWEFYIMSTIHLRLSQSPLSDQHPSIIPSLCKPTALHLFSDEAYLLENYLDQGNLLNLVNLARSDPGAQVSTLDESIAMFFMIELLRTVEAMHSIGILHGDIKADNCLVRLGPCPQSAGQSLGASLTSPITNTTSVTDLQQQWSSHYASDGSEGWSSRGLTLIDFGRGIDLQAFRPDVQFIADWKTGVQDCIEMRELRPWKYQVDYWGMAGVAHSLLFGKYLDDNIIATTYTNKDALQNTATTITTAIEDTVVNDENSQPQQVQQPPVLPSSAITTTQIHSQKHYRIREPLKRYWQTQIWTRLFDILLNPTFPTSTSTTATPTTTPLTTQTNNNASTTESRGVTDIGTGIGIGIGKSPCSASLRAVRREMELWLEGEGGKRNGGLKHGLRRLEERIKSAR